MASEKSIWKQIGLHNWLLKKEETEIKAVDKTLSPDDVYNYIVKKFEESIKQLSFANRIVFYHEYIVCFKSSDYQDFMNSKKGIFGLIIQESVKQFYEILKNYRQQGKTVEPSGNKWVFRFVSKEDYAKGDISFIGKLLPGVKQQLSENLRVTFIPRQTGIAQSFDVNENTLKQFTFYSDGYYEIPYHEDFQLDYKNESPATKIYCRFETVIPDKAYSGKKLEYLMKATNIIVSADEGKNDEAVFCIPSEWIDSPHLRVKYEQKDDKLYLCSFGEKTILNELEIRKSVEDNPSWTELPFNSKIMLNGIVGINVFKS
ncbi:MAG: hypothetical protein ABIW38_01500 [Ferruginibacter sp.]